MKVFITGTSSGFGRLLVTEFLKRGHEVLAGVRDLESRKQLFSDELAKYGSNLRLLNYDVTSALDADQLTLFLQKHWGGKLDVLVNNAGFGLMGPLEEIPEKELRQQFEVNFFGLVRTTNASLPFLRSSRGKIINLSSILGLLSFPMNGAYCASKFAVEGYSESLHHELAPHNVQVTLVEPGGFRTNFSKNMNWAVAKSETSPYNEQLNRFKSMHQKLAERPGSPPLTVAKKIVQISEQSHLPLRVLVGNDAKALKFLKRSLPSQWFSRILQRQFNG